MIYFQYIYNNVFEFHHSAAINQWKCVQIREVVLTVAEGYQLEMTKCNLLEALRALYFLNNLLHSISKITEELVGCHGVLHFVPCTLHTEEAQRFITQRIKKRKMYLTPLIAKPTYYSYPVHFSGFYFFTDCYINCKNCLGVLLNLCVQELCFLEEGNGSLESLS